MGNDQHPLSASTELRYEHYRLRVSGWKVSAVLRWLVDELELPQYSRKFEEMSIDGPMLLSLSDDDLKEELEIKTKLHRRKILQRVHSNGKGVQSKPSVLGASCDHSNSGNISGSAHSSGHCCSCGSITDANQAQTVQTARAPRVPLSSIPHHLQSKNSNNTNANNSGGGERQDSLLKMNSSWDTTMNSTKGGIEQPLGGRD
jgi:hypothetical protein